MKETIKFYLNLKFLKNEIKPNKTKKPNKTHLGWVF